MFKFIVNLLKKIPALHSFFKKLFHFINGNTMFGWNFGGGGGVIFVEEQWIYRKNFVS
jgi:hypothetical protein